MEKFLLATGATFLLLSFSSMSNIAFAGTGLDGGLSRWGRFHVVEGKVHGGETKQLLDIESGPTEFVTEGRPRPFKVESCPLAHFGEFL